MAEAKKPTKATTPGKSEKRRHTQHRACRPSLCQQVHGRRSDLTSDVRRRNRDGNPYQQTDHRVSSQHHQTDRRRLRDARALIESDIHR